MGLLEGRVAVVTGGGRGLGRAHALALAAEGAAVLVNDVGGAGDTVAAVVAGGGRAVADDHDVSSLDGGSAVVGHAVEALGRVDVVVNNAGISEPCPIEDLDDAAVGRHLGVHLLGTIGTTRAAFPHMRAGRGGRIVNTISGHAFDPLAPDSAAYAAAKGAVFAFTRAAALEGAPHGITVNAVAPLAYTDMSREYLSRVEGAAERFDPALVAAVVVDLVASDVTGRALRVEGRKVSEYRVEQVEWSAP